MNPHEQQYVDSLLEVAVVRFCERVIHRNAGAKHALSKLRAAPNGEGIWLDQFVTSFFQEALLDNPAGSCMLLEGLARRPVPAFVAEATIGSLLQQLAQAAFAELVSSKVEEALERAMSFSE